MADILEAMRQFAIKPDDRQPGEYTMPEMSVALQVSTETVRKRLRAMERQGTVIQRPGYLDGKRVVFYRTVEDD